MNRKLFIYAIFIAHLTLAIFLLQMPASAAPSAQLIRDRRPPSPLAEPLLQPLTVQISQTVPVTLTLGATSAVTTTTLTQTVPLTLVLNLNFVATQTLTSTVTASVTLSLADGMTVTVPVSLSLGTIPSTTLVITPLQVPLSDTITATLGITSPQEITSTTGITTSEAATETSILTQTSSIVPTSDLTITAPVTPTSATEPAIGSIASTTNVTANLRAGPGVAFEQVGQLGPGQPAVVTGVSADGTWYLLDTGAWIAVALLDNPPANPPVAGDPLIVAVQATATARAQTVPATPAAPILLPTATPTPPPAEPAEPPAEVAPPGLPPTVTVDANLRSGPGLEFPIIGGTITGQELTIVARNEAGDWFLLDNGGWIASFLIANPPAITDVPLFDPNQPPPVTEPITPTTPITTTETVTTTDSAAPTPAAPAPLGVADRLYLVDVDELLERYDNSLTEIDDLLVQASQNQPLLQDAQWVQSMTTAIALLRATNTRVQGLAPTTLLQPVQDRLAQAATSYEAAATLLSQGMEEQDTTLFDEAFIELARGNARLDSANDLITALTP
jgi:uncharacterized protein YraI